MTSDIKYDSWPLGKLPKHFQRPELDQVKLIGYDWDDPRDVVDMFEKKVAQFAGSKYAVAVDCATNALFLCMKFFEVTGTITIPSRTYVSVPMQIIHAGCKVRFEDLPWSGAYLLKPYPIWDASVRWFEGMYNGGLHVSSFQLKKRVPIGRGGMILTDNPYAYQWLKKASHDGRDLSAGYMDDDYSVLGWNAYMTPEDAARGIILMEQVPLMNEDSGGSNNYSDLSKYKIFDKHMVV